MKLKILDIKVTVSYALLCICALCIISGNSKGFLYCTASVLIHEAGHLAVMFISGFRPESIKISLFEISINDFSREQRSRKQNLLIIIFGPLCNFNCFILFYLLYLICGLQLIELAYTNLFLCLFNLLPVMSLDGGQLLYLILSCRLSFEKSEKVVNILTFITIFPLAALGFLLLFNSYYNFSLLFVCVYLILSLTLKNNRYF